LVADRYGQRIAWPRRAVKPEAATRRAEGAGLAAMVRAERPSKEAFMEAS